MTSGDLFVFSGPSGVGKSSLTRALAERDDNLALSISHTTRAPRPQEIAGFNYYYITEELFHQMIDRGDFLEYANIFGNYYGTSRVLVEERLADGKDLLLEIDWQGAQQIKAKYQACVTIFILPPSLAALELRLVKRKGDSQQAIAERVAGAVNDIAHYPEFDYLVINDTFNQTVDELRAIITSHRLKCARQVQQQQKLLHKLLKG